MSEEIPQTYDGNINMQPLISKLGHAVDEIRVRSLKNIIFKLDHDLIGIEDVVHKKEMFIKLLEWFNSDPCSHHKEVLELLEKLSTHSSAVETLVGIGGIEFFSHLRQDVDPSLYQIIDDILSNLLSLPGDILDGSEECQWLHYESGKKSVVLVPENCVDVHLVTPPGQTHGTVHSDGIYNSRQTPLHNKVFIEQQLPFSQEQFFENQLKCRDQHWHAEEVDNIKEGTACSWRFPWVRLAESDRGILSTTNTRLESHNPNLVKKSCEFLNDVLFKDFPAEIFLQRPSIIKTLLTVVEIKSMDNNTLSLSATSCLSGLCNLLRQRYLIMSDPSLYSLQPDCWKHWFGHGSSSSSGAASPVSVTSDLRTSGDGGQMSSDSSNTPSDRYVEVEEEDGLIREALEMNQMSLEEFSLQVLRGVCPLLNSVGEPLTLLAALQDVLKLLEVCCPSYQWWNNNKMKPLRQDICRVVAKTLNNHMLKCGLKRYEGQDIVEHNMSRHAMSVVNLSLWIINFFGPYLQAEWDDDEISQAFRETFFDLIMNEILFATYPEIRLCLERCPLVKGDHEFLGLYNKTLSIKRSFVASVEFLRNVRSKGDVSQDALIQTLSSTLLSLPYHRHLDLVTRSFTLISSVFERGCVGEEMKTKTKEVLLSLLSNLDDVVRRTSYECCVEVVEDALKYSHVTNPTSSYCMKALFVVDRDVLHGICAFGMTDQCEEISNLATKILETLLENRLNMSSRLWKKLLDDILTSLPYLQTHLGKRSKLATCLMGLLAPPGESLHCLTAEGEVIPFSEFERLRGSLRCMFHRDKMVRAKGYGYLIRRLLDEDARSKRDFVYPSGKLENSADLFILDTFASGAVRSHRSTKHAGFDDERIRKLFNIVATETTEVSLRRSSGEQLALLMEDPDWHDILLHEIAEDSLLRILEESLVKDGKVHLSSIVNPKLELVSPCLKIVRLLSEYNVRCRRKLSQISSVYRLVSRHALLAPSGGTVRYESSCLLTLLLFDEVARPPSFEEREKNGGDAMFALPALVLKRYLLPFNPPIYELSNPYQGERPSEEEDPLRSEPVMSQLRVAWNLAWSDDQNGISADGPEGSQDRTNEELRLLPLDLQLLKSYSAKAAIPEAITAIITATSHYAVRLSISKLSMYFLVENSMKRCQRADAESSRTRAREVFYSCDWKTAFERYFTVYPKSADDDRLLCEVLRMFRYLIQETFPPPLISFLGWLARLIMAPDSTVSILLSTPSPSRELLDVSVSETKRVLRKELLEFLSVFVAKLRGLSKPWLWSGEMAYAGDFTLSLTLNLNLTDSPQYYDLPILESTLQCLVELTAIPGFSAASKLVEPKGLCVELLTSLVQVFTAFHAGRLGALTSFMGRGVTMCVSLSLVHLVHEMSSVLKLQDWSTFFTTITDKESISEVSWLTAMWTDNLPEVRWSSLAIATHVVNHSGSPLSIKQNIAGGMWNLAVIILLDGKECCLVREQAVLLLATLLSTLKRNDVNEPDTGLSVQTEHEIINGIPALHLLLAHHHFYSSFQEMLRNVVFDNSQLPRTTTFADSLGSSSSRSKYGIPYQSLDTDSNSGGVPRSSESTKMTSSSNSSSRSRESTRRLLTESPATSNSGPAVSSGATSRASSTVPLITRSRTESESAREDVPSSASRVDSLEMLAWVTPRFVGSLCGMLRNLVCVAPDTVLNEVKEEDILGFILRHLDGKHTISLIHQLNNRHCRSRKRHLEMSLIDTLYMYTEMAVLLKTCCARDALVAHALQQNTMILEKLLDMLTITGSTLGDTVETACHKMWSSVVDLLLVSMKTLKVSQLLETQFEELLLKRWTVFAVAFKHVMHTDEAHLRTSFLHLLLHLLLREGKRVVAGRKANQRLADILDKNHEKREENTRKVIQNDVNTGTPQEDLEMTAENDKPDEFSGNGSELCSILLLAYDESKLQDKPRHNHDEKNYVVLALKNLFCVSRAAKATAVKAGFHVSSIDKIKQLHVALNVESLEVGKGSGTRKKELDLVNEIVKILELLKNLAFRCNETKLEEINHGIISMLQQLWSWCTVVKTLRLSVLELLCTLTARCSQASITMSTTSSTTASSVRLPPSNNTFVHCVIKMATKMMNKSLNNSTGDGNLASCQILFSLLKNIAMTSECRGILWKSNFISEFSRLKSLNHQKWKLGQKTVVSLWLELLANIAFYRDGQQMIVKIDKIIPLLLVFTSSSTKRVSESALLIVRNLCFHVPTKTSLLSNVEVVELLLRSADKPSVYVRCLAASALWALLTNNQKGKSILGKPALVAKRLSDSKHTLKPTPQGSDVNTNEQVQREQYENSIENILKILRI